MALIRKFWALVVLGWKIWTNWTEWYWFLLYSFVRPLFMVGVLFLIVYFAKGNQAMDYFYFILAGNLLFYILSGTSSGMVWTIFEDRNFYEMLIPIYIAPGNFLFKIIARSFGVGFSEVFTAFAILFLSMLLGSSYRLSYDFVIYVLLLFLAGVGFGLFLASLSLFMGEGANYLIEGTVSALQLLSGVSFSPYLLPDLLRFLAFLNPFLYLIEGGRRSMGLKSLFLMYISSEKLFIYSLLTTFLSLILGIIVFSWAEKTSKAKGTLTRKVNY